MQIQRSDGVLTITVTTDPVFHAMTLPSQVIGLLEPHDVMVVLDLHLVDLLHSPGLAQVVTLYVSLMKRGVAFVLANLNERNRRLMAITQLDHLVKVVTT